ncbi:unnamed protein product, partial [Menidia menidia]
RDIPGLQAKDRLSAVRVLFINGVSDSVLNQLLDKLLQHGAMINEEMQTAKTKPRAEKAPDVIDTVWWLDEEILQRQKLSQTGIFIEGYPRTPSKGQTFINGVSDSVLNQLLYKLLQHGAMINEVMQTAKTKPRAEKARDVIETVMRKGHESSKTLIEALREPKGFFCLNGCEKLWEEGQAALEVLGRPQLREQLTEQILHRMLILE